MNKTAPPQPQQQQQQASSDQQSGQDRTPSGINPDMPDDPNEAAGRPRGKTWGDRNCR